MIRARVHGRAGVAGVVGGRVVDGVSRGGGIADSDSACCREIETSGIRADADVICAGYILAQRPKTNSDVVGACGVALKRPDIRC